MHEISYKDLIMADPDMVSIFDVKTGQVKLELEATLERECTAVARDPHNSSLIAMSLDTSVQVLDMRSGLNKGEEFMAHEDQVLDLAYNTNKLHTLATCGAEGVLRFWDLRRPEKCLLQLEEDGGHPGHWMTKILFSPVHD